MAYMEWSQALEIGFRQIDEEHRSWLAALNGLHAALDQGKDRQEVERVLVFLRDYTVRHFETEEAMMIKHRYPGASAHFAAHSELVLKVSDLIADFRLGREVLTDAVLAFLETWLVDHIQAKDRELGSYMRARGVVA
jgi:hemerythrin